jgi:Toprim domain-containing protein
MPFPHTLYHDPHSAKDGSGNWMCALVGLATDKHGKYLGALQTRLTQTGWKVDEGKRMLGLCSLGAAVILREPVDGWMAYGEGLETCLSVWFAVPEIGVAAVGDKSRFRHAPIPDGTTKVILLQDNDDENGVSTNEHHYQQAKTYFSGLVETVRILKAPKPKTDFNDILRNDGIDAVHTFIRYEIDKPNNTRGKSK